METVANKGELKRIHEECTAVGYPSPSFKIGMSGWHLKLIKSFEDETLTQLVLWRWCVSIVHGWQYQIYQKQRLFYWDNRQLSSLFSNSQNMANSSNDLPGKDTSRETSEQMNSLKTTLPWGPDSLRHEKARSWSGVRWKDADRQKVWFKCQRLRGTLAVIKETTSYKDMLWDLMGQCRRARHLLSLEVRPICLNFLT